MHHFQKKDGQLWAEEVNILDLVEEHGTPLYIYSTATLTRHFQTYDSAFQDIPHLTCFSVKANSNLSVLKLLKDLGAGSDVVSGGELHRALTAGIDPKKIVFSGVGKQIHELEAGLVVDILMFNVESLSELYLLNDLAEQLNKTANISLRINPDVNPKTHPYISTGLEENKFGFGMDSVLETYKLAQKLPHIRPIGIDCHIGSQLTEISPFLESLDCLKKLYQDLIKLGLDIKYLDIGGGLGITYEEEEPPHPKELGQTLTKALQDYDLNLILEPGRVIAGNAGILVTQVLYTKQTNKKKFIIVDAAMNDLIRPSLYGAYHRIAEVKPQGRQEEIVDVVGPICESGDFIAKDRSLPQVKEGDCLAVFSSGAYAFTMASQYNSRPRSPEILVDQKKSKVVRHRETFEDLIRLEKLGLKE